MALDLHDYVASIPDYPEKGVLFRDISPLMAMVKLITKQLIKLFSLLAIKELK